MAHKKPLTPGAIDALKTGHLWDPVTPGLQIVVGRTGRKRWRFRRRLKWSTKAIYMTLGTFPAFNLAQARAWAAEINGKIEAGLNPCEQVREERLRTIMTVERAHGLYMEAVREGRASRARRLNKPRTILDKLGIYARDIAPALRWKSIHAVTEKDLVKLVVAKGKIARIRANRLASELKVFFAWAASLRGMEVGLEKDPSRRLGDLRFPEQARSRMLREEEIGWFLQALVEEEERFRRGMLLLLLTAARRDEVIRARTDELVDGVWTIPADRVKNSAEHRIALGPWGLALMQSDSEWVLPAPKHEGPLYSGWYKARDRIKARMEQLAGRPIERFTPHDFRRTVRSNTKRLKVDFDTAEAMLNHVKKGLERTYDRYELEDEKRAWFLKWENEVANMARRLGIADALGVPRQASLLSATRSDVARVTFQGMSPPLSRGLHAETARRLPTLGSEIRLAGPELGFDRLARGTEDLNS